MSNAPHDNNHDPGQASQFGLPEGYFERSAAGLMTRLQWLEEHRNWPALQQAKGPSGFAVPVAYFEKTEAQLEQLPYPRLSAGERGTGFSLPDSYFESTLEKHLAPVLSEAEPQLNTLPRATPFAVPAGYFEGNVQRLEALLTDDTPRGKVLPLVKRRRWAVAAAAAVLLVLGGVKMYTLFFTAVPKDDCGALACVDRADLLKGKTLENLETDELYELVNSAELEKKLQQVQTPASEHTSDSAAGKSGDALDELLDGI